MSNASPMKAPEWLVFLRALLLGIVLAEVWRIGRLTGSSWGQQLADDEQFWSAGIGIVVVGLFLIFYVHRREARQHAWRMMRSWRIDLGLLVLAGAWISHLLAPRLVMFHDTLSKLDKGWSQAALMVLLIILSSALFRPLRWFRKPDQTQMRFASDVEIEDPDQDSLHVSKQAFDFADTVLISRASSGMVFGLDGPWGIGKTSFLNIATKRWTEVADDDVIVFRFEPLRYAAEPDLSERFIRDLCARIQQKVFAPEFSPAATRYSRMLKGQTDVSILGVKLTLGPSSETIDDLLVDVDNLLEEIGRRLIIIIEDLDRLEPKLVNNVLFMVRRTLKLSQATYILCYDTEQLVAGKEEGSRAREFLEKFINAKLSLFVDLRSIKAFLERDWHADSARFQAMPAQAMLSLRQITSEVCSLLSGPQAHDYTPFLGDLRKVKRFVNALLLMNLERTDPEQAGFNNRDLIHLLLLHLGYPGLFRKIYAEETEDRRGAFSVRRGTGPNLGVFENAPGLEEVVQKAELPAQFLLKQLFDLKAIDFPPHSFNDEVVRRTRACFNSDSRNLEKYLQLIVRLKVPDVAATFKLYMDLLGEILKEKKTVAEILESPVFAMRSSENAHDQFWRILVNNAQQLGREPAEDAIATLVTWLPRYSMIGHNDNSLRQRSIYTLALFLDRAGFGEPRNGRIRSENDVVEIAERILGGGQFLPPLVEQLIAPERGVLGWEDLMLFRLVSCANRLGQMHNLYTALIRFEDPSARYMGDLDDITLNSMRRFSQQVFQEFKQRFIDVDVNFYTEVDKISDAELLGDFEISGIDGSDFDKSLEVVRAGVKSFVIYQLTNQRRNDGTGIGCGVYDEAGSGDAGGIHQAMCDYLLGFCFNPVHGMAHARAFGDFCLRAFRDQMMERLEIYDAGVVESLLTQLLGRENMRAFWASSGERIKSMLANESGTVLSHNYEATYAHRLPLVFKALDGLIALSDPVSNESPSANPDAPQLTVQ